MGFTPVTYTVTVIQRYTYLLTKSGPIIHMVYVWVCYGPNSKMHIYTVVGFREVIRYNNTTAPSTLTTCVLTSHGVASALQITQQGKIRVALNS